MSSFCIWCICIFDHDLVDWHLDFSLFLSTSSFTPPFSYFPSFFKGLIRPLSQVKATSPNNGRVYVNKAQDVVTSMLAKGSAFGQDAMNKAKAFDEKHQLTATASAKVISFDRRVGLTEKLTVGISAVNEKVKSVDQRLQVSDKTMAALLAAERKLNNTGSAVKTSRYTIVSLLQNSCSLINNFMHFNV